MACKEREPELASLTSVIWVECGSVPFYHVSLPLSLREVLAEVGVHVRLCLKGASGVVGEELMKKENEK